MKELNKGIRTNLLSIKFFIVFSIFGILSVNAKSVHVLVWDERQPSQKEAYANWLGNEIASQLRTRGEDLEIRSVGLDDPEQGLSIENLDWADVIIWWGHVRQDEISPEIAQQKLIERLKSGKLNMIFLHSAHFSTPFMEAMNDRTKTDARKKYPDPVDGVPIEFDFILLPGRNTPARNSLVTPAYYALKRDGIVAKVRVDLPNCCFPAYRSDGKPSNFKVLKPDHPLAQGLPTSFNIAATEMYDEPFHVPEPDEVLFEETWEGGEHFRSGLIWNVGQGKVFYFRPGHETFPVFKQREIIQVLVNACKWLSPS